VNFCLEIAQVWGASRHKNVRGLFLQHPRPAEQATGSNGFFAWEPNFKPFEGADWMKYAIKIAINDPGHRTVPSL
ncbi:MAG TPA: hypothetical protein VL024_01525, partial [Castellaniella sp.]|nr:hypothetical protein [Castellaniella sp.]